MIRCLRGFSIALLLIAPARAAYADKAEDEKAWHAAQATQNQYVIEAVRQQLLQDHPEYREWLQASVTAPAHMVDSDIVVASTSQWPRTTGEAQLGMENDTGNTDNRSYNAKGHITRENEDWIFLGLGSVAYGKSDGKTNTANYRALAQANYKLEPDTRWMSTLFWNSNRFTGFSDRFEEVTGLSNDWMLTSNVKLTTELAGGVREVKLTNGAQSVEPILWLRGNLNWPFAKRWVFVEDLRNSYGPKYNFLWSNSSITTPLDAHWKVRLSYEADYVNNPPLDRESLDTISLVSLVYGF